MAIKLYVYYVGLVNIVYVIIAPMQTITFRSNLRNAYGNYILSLAHTKTYNAHFYHPRILDKKGNLTKISINPADHIYMGVWVEVEGWYQ